VKRLPMTPSQTIGPFFRLALERPEWSDLARGGARGEAIVVEGRVLDGDGAPVDDALLETWQANAEGTYDHPEDAQAGKTDPAFRGFGRALTDAQGLYRFTTVRPGRVAGPGGALQAPHLEVAIFARGLLKRLVTRVYFEGDPANEADPVLGSIAEPSLRRTLIAARERSGGGPGTYRFDIVLQGEGETAFFDL
jgi:protocatechuate 3,4-dioxygenase alpha subunit